MHNPGSESNERRFSPLVGKVLDDGCEIIQCQAAHFNLMLWRPFDRAYTLNLPNFEQRMQEIVEGGGPAATVVDNGRVIACIGAVLNGQGGAYVWMYGSVYLQAALHRYVRKVQELLETLFKECNLKRVQTVCVQEDVDGCKWVESLGFVSEGVMRHYDANGKDYVMYALVKDEAATPPAEATT